MSHGLSAWVLAVRARRIFTALLNHFDDRIEPAVRPNSSCETIWAVSSTMFAKPTPTSSTAPLNPRLLNRRQAAAYCNLSPTTFSNWVRSGKLPPPLPGTTRWDLKAIDFALDALSGLRPSQETSALDEWRENRARRSERSS
jgi:predicted DNA-binding transcriptional regulator AlpA